MKSQSFFHEIVIIKHEIVIISHEIEIINHEISIIFLIKWDTLTQKIKVNKPLSKFNFPSGFSTLFV